MSSGFKNEPDGMVVFATNPYLGSYMLLVRIISPGLIVLFAFDLAPGDFFRAFLGIFRESIETFLKFLLVRS